MTGRKGEKHKVRFGKPRIRARWSIKPTERVHCETGYRRRKTKEALRKEMEESRD